MHATVCAWLEVIGYNTGLVARDEAPRSYADPLDPKRRGKLVKGHPSYSGAILTATYLLARDLGWSYFEKLAQQRVMQVQSAADPPKKVLAGERAVMADGNDYNLVLLKEQGQSVEVVYAAEGSPLITVHNGVFRSAPNPNAARLFQSFMFGAEAQQLLLDAFAHRSFHALVKEKPGRTPLSAVKMLRADPAAVWHRPRRSRRAMPGFSAYSPRDRRGKDRPSASGSDRRSFAGWRRAGCCRRGTRRTCAAGRAPPRKSG